MPFQLSEDTTDKLLDKLSSDDKFRDLFQKDPRQALATVGHKEAADKSVEEGPWMCMTVGELASKEAIKASRDVLRTQLASSKVAYQPIALEASKR
ncbi:NHLP-related RiPP peptide [Arenimonas sp. MALMAid1274]|uniref:NHLP-related RiPP peptide n=1 Tax=Arenimonas sp. MALMAid1274 TaxID=3411630 RepID=UPI003B9FE45D